MTDFPFTADVVLLNSGETARKGMYVEFGLHHEIDGPIQPGDRNPFMDIKQGREHGQRFRVTFHLLADDESTTEIADDETPEPVELRNKPISPVANWSEAKRRMVQRSGILRNEKGFQDYVANGWPGVWNHERHREAKPSDKAAYFIRTSCGVESCSDLDPIGPSGARFREMEARYVAAQQGRTDEDLRAQRSAGP